ncbi:hypothetical protein EHI8A_064140 [Entamoeba histolytica HM-1:IMSS-B]|uniref:Uncharacterized protein n=7 Tax=Entamoeba TaxID=5758 RepID=B1N4Y8_ENTH1|nr:hypothetical protein EHI_167490 [Entamoeba histolytica HM-1:IMSS]XP_008856829.1 hypothetical protein ENU1_078090 [Entamoeba nuttalli P19]EMD48105.1 Hypothetical protein EHI5A_096260 [Entamoeba histolytica KU27]EMH72922.1 hypothetical protein EHI8A_064140 [Entamoeba histolytica HM-1:IMSS-B]EMS15112.1 hypothetical protein KM1_116340 [Entamoeba histolytica HM-3:IMSS]ENY62234.1 hypothetical protein EHI7A_061210 [Entamoeba histolytica HM-1:IMSS-A]GAT99031.1 hypothetical protein CL6EHI_167490 [E|eukprot:XP_008856829.1 hypothetical protein ENU1_078090 [Entamoeba nuttalli P19]
MQYISFDFEHQCLEEIGHLGILGIIYESYTLSFGNEHKCSIELIDYEETKSVMKGILRVKNEDFIQVYSSMLMTVFYKTMACNFKRIEYGPSLLSIANTSYLINF